MTKNQIAKQTGSCFKTVERAWAFLIEEGTLVPIKNHKGGRSVPTTFRLEAAGQGHLEKTSTGRAGEDPQEARAKAIIELMNRERISWSEASSRV